MLSNQSVAFFCVTIAFIIFLKVLFLNTSYENQNQNSIQYNTKIFEQKEKNRVLLALKDRFEFGKLMESLKGKK